MDLSEFRQPGGVARAVGLLCSRVQVLLVAEWARSVIPIIEAQETASADTALRFVEAAIDLALNPPAGDDALQIARQELGDGIVRRSLGNIYSRAVKASRAVREAVAAAIHPATAANRAQEMAGCVARAAQSPNVTLAGKWAWLFTTYQQALGPDDAFVPTWRTSTTVALARGIVRERALDRMPILADALRDAGCVEAALVHLGGECTFADWTLWNLLGLDERRSD